MKKGLLFAASLFLGSTVQAVSVTIVVQEYPLCVYPYGALNANASGGVGPYTYLWSTGSMDAQIYQLLPGTYSVTVTDFNGEQATDQITLTSQPLYGSPPIWVPGCPDPGFPGGPGRRLFLNGWPSAVGMAPFISSDWGELSTVLDPLLQAQFIYVGADPYAPGQSFNFTITDVNGCQTQVQGVAPPYPQWLQPQLMDVSGACSGGSNGSLTLFVPAEPNGWGSTMRLFHQNGLEYGWGSQGWNITTGATDMTLHATGLPAGIYRAVQHFSWNAEGMNGLLENVFSGLDGSCRDTLTIEVPDLGYTCGTLSGRAFVDANENCLFGSSDASLPSTIVEVQPGDHYAISDVNGFYTMNLPYGSYTAADQNALYQEHCGMEGSPFVVSMGQTNVTRNFADTSLTGLDVRVSMGSGAARPGFGIGYVIRVENLTGVLSGNGTLTFTYDPAINFLSAGVQPTSHIDNTITWDFSSLGAFAARSFHVSFQVPPDINLLGQVLASSATMDVAGTDVDLANNATTHTVTVTGSYDPNDKSVRTTAGVDGLYLIDEDDRLEYTIRFQNTGTDTAFFVVVTDTLQPGLDPGTFQLGVCSHPMTLLLRDNVLRFMFANILLPDSNVNELASHGFITYSIRPRQSVLPGTVLENIANIFFDFNPPVITEPSLLVAEFSTRVGGQTTSQEQVRLQPNPASDQIRLSDATLAAATRAWTIQCSDGRIVRSSGSVFPAHGADISDLAVGNYLLKIISDDRSIVIHFAKTH